MKIKLKNIIIAPLALMNLSACAYSDGYGQSNLGYADDQYCDPYNEYDAYYGCDLEYGFANFGYGGGWYQDYYYPGFGFYIFDNSGRRFRMNDYYLGYWGRQRQQFFQSRFSNRSFSGNRLRSFPSSQRNGQRSVRNNRAAATRRADGRNNGNRQDRRTDSDGAGARQRGTNGNAQQAANGSSQPPRARQPQNSSERSRPPAQRKNPPAQRNNSGNSKPPKARPARVKQNRNTRPSSSKGTWQQNNTHPE